MSHFCIKMDFLNKKVIKISRVFVLKMILILASQNKGKSYTVYKIRNLVRSSILNQWIEPANSLDRYDWLLWRRSGSVASFIATRILHRRSTTKCDPRNMSMFSSNDQSIPEISIPTCCWGQVHLPSPMGNSIKKRHQVIRILLHQRTNENDEWEKDQPRKLSHSWW